MNIFVLDTDPVKAAQMMCDKHVVKMVLETAQILSTVMAEIFPSDMWYKPTHRNHPCVKWASESYENFRWLYYHGWALKEEYAYRYGKRHKSTDILNEVRWLLNTDLRSTFSEIARTPFVLAMPDDCKLDDPVVSYRLYYMKHKSGIATWKKNRPKPEWYHECT